MHIRKNAALFGIILAGCGGGSNDANVTVGTSQAKGSVGGVVLDATKGLTPLAGVMVTVLAGGNSFTATTDMAGTYTVKEVPAGTVVVHLASADHFDVYLTGALAGNAGNFPVSNAALTLGPTVMLSNKGTLSLKLVNQDGGPAQAGVKVTARAPASYLDLSSGQATARGTVISNGQSAADGLVTIDGLPDFLNIGPLLNDTVTIDIPPIKVMAGDTYEFLGLQLQMNPTQLAAALGQTPTIVLAGPRSPLAVLASNVDWFETGAAGAVGSQVNGPVTVAFNQAVDPTTVRAELLTEAGALSDKIATAAVTNNLVTVSFSAALGPGRYNLVFHADSLYKDQAKEYNTIAPFFAPQPMGTMVSIANASGIDPKNPDDYILDFTEPIGLGGGSGSVVPCVVFFDASLDGNPNVTSVGEWNAGGSTFLKCETNFNAHPGLFLRPDEGSFGVSQASPITGFSSRWRIFIKLFNDACTNPMAYSCCVGGSTVHLAFSRNSDAASLVKRANGSPVPDITFNLPSFMCP